MTKYDDTNRWKLFRNATKKSDKSPDFSGEIDIDGVVYRLNGWVQEGKAGRFFSGSVRPKENQVTVDSTTTDSDIPF